MAIHPDFSQLYEAIRKANRILVVGDGRPDGDSMGSSSAVLTWLIDQRKDVKAFCIEPIRQTFGFLDQAHLYTNDPATFDLPYDLVMIFDAGDLKHGGIEDLLPKAPKTDGRAPVLANIDHHATNARYGDINVVFPEASSTCEVVYRFFDELNIPMDHRMATSLLCGIITDTSAFTNAGTTTIGIEAAGRLVALGARYQDILTRMFKNKPIEGLRVWGLALSRLQYDAKRDIATTYLLRADTESVPAESLDGLSNFLNAVCGFADTVLVLRETEGGIVKGSMRSLTRDVSAIAKKLGGGGHKKAAAFTLEGTLRAENGKVRILKKN